MFKQSNTPDNDVDSGLRQISNFHFSIRPLKSFDEAFQSVDEIVGSRSAQIKTIFTLLLLRSPFDNLDAENPHPFITLH